MDKVTIETGQSVFGDPDWAVVSGGTYPADTLVECLRIASPGQRVAFYALTIATGEYPQ